MDLLRSVHPGVFFFALFMVLLLAGIMVAAAIATRRKAAALAGVAALPPRNLVPGYRLVTGRAIGPALTAPLTGRTCVWYEARVWESRRDTRNGESEWRWHEIADETPDRGIEISDGKVSCLFRHHGADMRGSSWSEWTGNENPPTEKKPPVHPWNEGPGGGIQVSVQGTFGPRFRFREAILAPGETVFALGDCSATESLPPVDDDDPEASELYPEEVGARWVMRKARGRPFLLTTRPPETELAEAELAGKAAVPFGLALAALAAFMLWARFGG